MSKIGVGITTFNSENYYSDLYKSLPPGIDELVTVNGGTLYKDDYTKTSDWVQHSKNRWPALCRNDCITTLLNRGCEHIFLIEDDMLILRKDTFEQYVNASLETGIRYFSYVSTSWESGNKHNRTPKLIVDYESHKIALYPHMCNEFTYHRSSNFKHTDFYDSQFRYIFDIDLAYRIAEQGLSSPFWWFADLLNSDELVSNNPAAESRLNKNGNRDKNLEPDFDKFKLKHGLHVPQISICTSDDVRQTLKELYKNKTNENFNRNQYVSP